MFRLIESIQLMSIKKGILHRPCPMCPYKHRSQFVISCLRVSSITHLFPAVRLQAAAARPVSCLGLGAAPNSCIPFKHDDTLAIIPPSRMESYHEIECNNELPSGCKDHFGSSVPALGNFRIGFQTRTLTATSKN